MRPFTNSFTSLGDSSSKNTEKKKRTTYYYGYKLEYFCIYYEYIYVTQIVILKISKTETLEILASIFKSRFGHLP